MDRREFLRDVGTGVVVASIGSSMADDLGFSSAFASQGAERITFGNLEPLVSLMQETPAARLIPQIVERLRNGTPLRDVVAAAALANARTFGGEDYIGFHTMMAIAPAYYMAQELPEAQRALPVLKVLFRNATRIQEQGGTAREVLRPVQANGQIPAETSAGEALRDTVRRDRTNPAAAERLYAGVAGNADDAHLSMMQYGYDHARVKMRCWHERKRLVRGETSAWNQVEASLLCDLLGKFVTIFIMSARGLDAPRSALTVAHGETQSHFPAQLGAGGDHLNAMFVPATDNLLARVAEHREVHMPTRQIVPNHCPRAMMGESAIEMEVRHDSLSGAFRVDFAIELINPLLIDGHPPASDEKDHRWNAVLDRVKMLMETGFGGTAATAQDPDRVGDFLIGANLKS